MDFKQYEQRFRLKAHQEQMSEEEIQPLLAYAKSLHAIGVPVIFDQKHFSLLCGVKLDYLLKVSSSCAHFYKCYLLPKKSSRGFRHICEPYPTLKYVQEWILKNILNAVAEKFVSPVAKAYMPGRTIVENVRFHKRRKLVLKIDLVDFFGSIKVGQVLHVFNNLGYKRSVSTLLANLCVYNGQLPQGAPTSPMLSNLVVKGADDEIFNYCKDKKIMYTRYADDLTFSGDFEIKPLMTLLHKVMFRYGFKINRSKTKILSQAVCQKVTNIVVNEKIQGSRTYRMKLRQEVHYIHKYGLDEHLQHISSPLSAEQYLASLRGRVGYALYINKNDDELKRYREYLFKLATELHHRL